MPTIPQKKNLGYVTLARNMPMPTPCFLVRLRYATEPAQVLPTLRYTRQGQLRYPVWFAVKFFSKLNYFIFGFLDPTNTFFDNKNKYFYAVQLDKSIAGPY